jgi:hypothetical protein
MMDSKNVSLSNDDIEAIQRTNWVDGFRWGLFLGGMFVLLLEFTFKIIVGS